MKYKHLAGLVFNQPLLCTEDYAETILAVMGEDFGVDPSAYSVNSTEAREQSVKLEGDGTFVLPIIGSMTHRASSLDALSGIQSYQDIKNKLQAAVDDPKVKSILLDVDSPGGTVSGAFDLRDYILSIRGKKPIVALARDSMASAAYLISSATDKVYTTQTGRVGSIGVVAMHVDKTEAVKRQGIKPTFLYKGHYKTAGNAFEKLEGEKFDYLQDGINSSYELFVNAVAESRGLKAEAIRDTEARVYLGKAAVEAGLADSVKSYEEVIEELASQREYNSKSINLKGPKMDKDKLENAETDVVQLSAEVEKLKTANETLQALIIGEGYKITAEGLVKESEPEMIEVAGVMTDKASLPEHVVTALESAAKEKEEATLKADATAALPNFAEDQAVTLFSALSNLDEDAKEKTLTALKSADTALGQLMKEDGETDTTPDLVSYKDKLDAMIQSAQAEHNVSRAKATADVLETAEGKALWKQVMKEDK